MGRSAESLAKRKEYYKKWRERNPEYHKEWRIKNAKKERERVKAWRSANPDKLREQKIRYYLAHRAERVSKRQPDIPIPSLHVGHELFDHAKAIVNKIVKIDHRTQVYDPLYEDAVSETVLALLEGKSPTNAVLAFKAKESEWKKNVNTGTGYDGIFDVSDSGYAY